MRSEKLDALSRELQVEVDCMAAWRDEFPSGGKEALKAAAARLATRTARFRRRNARSAS